MRVVGDIMDQVWDMGQLSLLLGNTKEELPPTHLPPKQGSFLQGIFFFFFELGEGMQVMLHFWYPGQENLSVLDARGGNSLVQSQQQTPLLCFWRKQKINKNKQTKKQPFKVWSGNIFVRKNALL